MWLIASSVPLAAADESAKDIEARARAFIADAEKAGKAPLYAGQPGYRSELDPDGPVQQDLIAELAANVFLDGIARTEISP